MGKVIVGLESFGIMKQRALECARCVDAGMPISPADYHLNFETIEQLCTEITPRRMMVIETLLEHGALSDLQLAGRLSRSFRAVQADLARLKQLGLVAKDREDGYFVPWDDVELHLGHGAAKVA